MLVSSFDVGIWLFNHKIIIAQFIVLSIVLFFHDKKSAHMGRPKARKLLLSFIMLVVVIMCASTGIIITLITTVRKTSGNIRNPEAKDTAEHRDQNIG